MGSVYAWKHQQIYKICTEKHPFVQRFIPTVCIMYNNLNMQSVS